MGPRLTLVNCILVRACGAEVSGYLSAPASEAFRISKDEFRPHAPDSGMVE